MDPQEHHALDRARTQLVKATAVVIVIAVAVMLVAAVVLAVQRATAQHLLGMSEKQQGVVTAIDEVRVCSRRNTDTYTVEWVDGAETHTGTFGLCGNPYAVGEELTVWVTDGELQTDPPWMVRMGVGIPTAMLITALVLTLRHVHRRRRSLAGAVDGSWQPESVRSLGLPGTAAFRSVARDGSTTSISGWRVRFVHSATGSSPRPAAPADDMPGEVLCDRVRHGRPKGLCLHIGADGSRTWFTR